MLDILSKYKEEETDYYVKINNNNLSSVSLYDNLGSGRCL